LQYSGAPGDRIYIVLFKGTKKALHLDTERSTTTINTNGNTFGHNAGMNTITMAATYYGSAHKGVVPFTGFANPVETFSSDGPRKIFFTPAGVEITPGNVLFSTNGGTTLQKPDLTAADGVFTKTPGFLPFFGTSAAAPHAAGIAALVVSVRPGYTPAQVKKAMTATALDNEAVGWDPNGGWGVAMANGTVNYALSH
jgi:subtilisin family serine protease